LKEITLGQLETLSKLQKGLPIGLDRRKELTAYFKLPDDAKIDAKAMAHGKFFTSISTDEGLIDCYRAATFAYSARMMLGYNRFHEAYGLFQSLPDIKGKVIDYGCGVADYGIAFAILGWEVSICDIMKGPLEFAMWRFNQRNLLFHAIPANEEDLYPDLGVQDLVIAGEILEHLRDPIKALERIDAALSSGGFLFTSGYPFRQHITRADHLVEAKGMIRQARAFIDDKFEQLSKSESLQKIKRVKIEEAVWRKK
jgi:2-polyprenyl-3-methyl-5-hydroxy-6-metoxy-1,4-benzoquinol methylase